MRARYREGAKLWEALVEAREMVSARLWEALHR